MINPQLRSHYRPSSIIRSICHKFPCTRSACKIPLFSFTTNNDEEEEEDEDDDSDNPDNVERVRALHCLEFA